MGELHPHLIHDSLDLPESTTQTVDLSRSVQPSLQDSRLWQSDRQTDRQTDRPNDRQRYSVC